VIVLAGEASQATFTELGVMALAAVGTDEVVIATGIDPADVVAHGAAVFAHLVLKDVNRDRSSDCGYGLKENIVETGYKGPMLHIGSGRSV
jgi:hypothetical protein